jgi:NAD+ synthase (glutamine-hydrolysing)
MGKNYGMLCRNIRHRDIISSEGTIVIELEEETYRIGILEIRCKEKSNTKGKIRIKIILMKVGIWMFKIALAQIEVIPGRPDINTNKMLTMIETAKENNADVVIFSEMAIPGYLIGDMWEQESFLRDCEMYGDVIRQASAGICVMFGNVAMDWTMKNNDGRVRKYDAFFVAKDKQFWGDDNFPYPFRIKTLHANYREFEDDRHFYSLLKFVGDRGGSVLEYLKPVYVPFGEKVLSLGCLLCEDGWSDDYPVAPTSILGQHQVDLLVNISCSPFTAGKNSKRNRLFSRQVKNLKIPLVYVNNVGIQNNGKTVYTFDGSTTVYNADGDVVHNCAAFEETMEYIDLDQFNDLPPLIPASGFTMEAIYQALQYGTKQFINAIGVKDVVIGISGGIDSAVAAALYAKVLGPEHVFLVNMPSLYNSKTTRGLAYELAEKLGCWFTEIPIQQSVDHTVTQIGEATIKNLATGVKTHLQVSPFVTENIQARDRSARILAALAATIGGGFTCNANKAEMTVGYCTLYGDEAGFLAPLADLWKYQVYELAHYFNEHVYSREVIPQGIIKLKPSAELSYDQAVDEGKGDPIIYSYHDYLFQAFVERWNRATPEDILAWYLDGSLEEKIGCQRGLVKELFVSDKDFIADLERWWKLYMGMGVAKRIQAPPVLAVSRRAFGFDHREAQNGWYLSSRYLAIKNNLLGNQE